MAHYKIQKGIPIPVGDWNKDQYPLAEMEMGDSFLVIFAEDKRFTRRSITDFEKLNPLFKFLHKKVGLKQYRVWRVPANNNQEKEYLEVLAKNSNIEPNNPIDSVDDALDYSVPVEYQEKKVKRTYNTKKRQLITTQDLESIEEPVSSSQVIVGQM